MKLNKFKIPTLLGLSIIFIGIIAGVILVLREQIFISKASPAVNIQDILISNISDTEVTISYQTSVPVTSFISFGQTSPSEQTAQDDRDSGTPQPHAIYYITLKNLLPQTTYQYKIISGKTQSEIQKFTTAAPLASQAGFRPIIGTVLDKDKPLDEGVVFLSIADATTQSALIKSGNFLIPLSQIRKSDLADIFPLSEDTTGKLLAFSDNGSASALFKFKISNDPLPTLYLGQNIDLTSQPETLEINKFDLNDDGKINAADNAIVLDNFGKSLKNQKADLNKDGVVDQTDLDLMAKQINQ